MDVFAALAPSAGLLVLFIVLMRAIVLADRRERAALARARTERAADRAAGPPGAPLHDNNAPDNADDGRR